LIPRRGGGGGRFGVGARGVAPNIILRKGETMIGQNRGEGLVFACWERRGLLGREKILLA